MRRGDILVASAPGDYGKPRPVVVVQSDRLTEGGSLLACLVTSQCREAPLYRLLLEPTATNGLKRSSDVMIDKVVALPRHRYGALIGQLTAEQLATLDQRLAVMIGLSDG